MQIEVTSTDVKNILANLMVQPTLIERIKVAQQNYIHLCQFKKDVDKGLRSKLRVHSDGTLYFRNRLCILGDPKLKKKILEEAHKSHFSVHPGSTKMYRDLK